MDTVCDTDEEMVYTRDKQSTRLTKNQKPNFKRLHNFSPGEAPKAKMATRVSRGDVALIPDGHNIDKWSKLSAWEERDKTKMTAPDKKKTQTTRKTRLTSLPRNKTNATKN